METISQELARHETKCADQISKFRELYRDPGSENFQYATNGSTIHLTTHAEGQLLARLRLPVSYIHRCTNALQAENVNFWIQAQEEKEIFVRWYENTVRAVFSTRYKADMDDNNVIPVVLDALTSLGEDLHIKTFVKRDDFTMLKVLFKEARTQHEDDICFAGVTIVNSEVGKSSLWIKPIIRNGNASGAWDFVDASKEGSTAFRHTGELKKDKIIAAIQHAKKVAEVGIYRVLEASKTIVDNPVQEVKDLVEGSDFLTQQLVDIIEEEYQNTVEATQLQLAQSMLQAVAQLPLFKRYLAEKEVGRYLSLFQDTDERFSLIVQENEQLVHLAE